MPELRRMNWIFCTTMLVIEDIEDDGQEHSEDETHFC
jgi:hypothetical protein